MLEAGTECWGGSFPQSTFAYLQNLAVLGNAEHYFFTGCSDFHYCWLGKNGKDQTPKSQETTLQGISMFLTFM